MRSAAAVRAILNPRSGLRRAVWALPQAARGMAAAAQQPPAALQEAMDKVQTLSSASNADKLQLYALYKQATAGTDRGSAPSSFNFVAKAKYDAWEALGDMSAEDAVKAYVDKVAEMAGEDAAAESASASAEAGAFTDIKYTVEDGLAVITMNRPKKFNAITYKMYKEIGEALQQAGQDPKVRVAMLTGAGEYYCSGNDLSNFANIPPGGVQQLADEAGVILHDFVDAFITFPKPLIAAVNGPAVGIAVSAGVALADVVWASSSATFHTPFTALGQSPEACSSVTFPAMVGGPRAAEMLLFGRKITAGEAKEWGMASEVMPADKFAAEALAKAKQMAKLPPQALQLGKGIMRKFSIEHLKTVNQAEVDLIKTRWVSDECMNAIMSFMSRKK